MKRLFIAAVGALLTTVLWAQGVKPLPTLHVEGRWLTDSHGNHVVLHGVMDTPNMYFNGWRWGSPWDGSNTGYNSTGATKCLAYFEKLFSTAIAKAEKHGADLYCGEYGVIDVVPGADTLKWYREINMAFEEYGIGRAAWTYRGMDFGLADERYANVIKDLVKYL